MTYKSTNTFLSKTIRNFLVIFFLLFFVEGHGIEKGSGTLIVCYRTDTESSRLDRIRFWLVNEKGDRHLYPTGETVINDPGKLMRMVLLENVPAGDYTLEFLIPNADNLFKPVAVKSICVSNGGVTKLEEVLQMYSQNNDYDEVAAIFPYDNAYQRPESEIYIPKTGQRFYSYPSYNENVAPSSFVKIRSTLPGARWKISKGSKVIASGTGSSSGIALRPGSGYRITGENFGDYSLNIYPKDIFEVGEGRTTTIDLTYKKSYGDISIEAEIPTGEAVDVTIEGSNLTNPVTMHLVSANGLISGKSQSLPPGKYHITMTPAKYFQTPRPVSLILKKGENAVIKPEFTAGSSLKVVTNNPSAVFF